MADTQKPKRFRLRIPGANEDVPRELTAYGKACQGEFAVTLLPLSGKAAVVLVPKVPRGHKGPKPAMAWQSPGTWKDPVPAGEDHDVPRMPDVELTEAEGAEIIASLRKAAPKKAGPTAIRGQWRGVVICGPAGPVVELRRKVSTYAELVVRSDAEVGAWRWTITRSEKWFSEPVTVEGTAPRLLSAIRDGFGSFLEVMGPACSRRDTQRRAAHDPAYAEKRPIREARTPKRDALGWLAEANKPAGLQPKKGRGLTDTDVVNAAALADPAVAALYAKTRMPAMAYAKARTAKAAATWVEAAVKALGGDFHVWKGRFERQHADRVSKGDQVVVRTATPPTAPDGVAALISLGKAMGRLDKKRMPIVVEFASAATPPAPAPAPKRGRKVKPVLIVWDTDKARKTLEDSLDQHVAKALGAYFQAKGGTTVQSTVEVQVLSALPGDAGRSLHYVLSPAKGAAVTGGMPARLRIERKHNTHDLGPLSDVWTDTEEGSLVRATARIRADLSRLRHVWRKLEARATSGVDFDKGPFKKILTALRQRTLPKTNTAAARSIGGVTADQVGAVRTEVSWHIERMKLEGVVGHSLGRVPVAVVETIANWQRLGNVPIGDVVTVLRVAGAQGALPKGDKGRTQLSNIAEQAGIRFNPEARPKPSGAPEPPGPPGAAPGPGPGPAPAAAPAPARTPGPSGLTVLDGHTSERTAYLVDDYPYGRRVRTSIRYWLETDKKRGMRFVSQTKNPKTGRWNKPKKSTYSDTGLLMYADEDGHVLPAMPPWLMEDRVGFLAKFPAAPTRLLRMMVAQAKAERRFTEREIELVSKGRTGVEVNGVAMRPRKGDTERLEARMKATETLLQRLHSMLESRKVERAPAPAPKPAPSPKPAPAPRPAPAPKPAPKPRKRPTSKSADDAISKAVQGQLKLALGEFFGAGA